MDHTTAFGGVRLSLTLLRLHVKASARSEFPTRFDLNHASSELLESFDSDLQHHR